MDKELDTLDRNVGDGNWHWEDFYEDGQGRQLKVIDHIGLLELIVRLAKFHEFWEAKDPDNKEGRMRFGGYSGSYQWIADWPTVPGDQVAEDIKYAAKGISGLGEYAPNSMEIFLTSAIATVEASKK